MSLLSQKSMYRRQTRALTRLDKRRIQFCTTSSSPGGNSTLHMHLWVSWLAPHFRGGGVRGVRHHLDRTRTHGHLTRTRSHTTQRCTPARASTVRCARVVGAAAAQRPVKRVVKGEGKAARLASFSLALLPPLQILLRKNICILSPNPRNLLLEPAHCASNKPSPDFCGPVTAEIIFLLFANFHHRFRGLARRVLHPHIAIQKWSQFFLSGIIFL